MTIGALMLPVLASTFLQGAYLRGASQAFFVMLILGLVLLVFAVRTHAWNCLCGAWAEDNTREAVAQSLKAGQVWGQVSSIEVGGVDIDHVVIAPGGILMLESKWAFAPLEPDRCREHAAQALGGARKLRSILRSATVKRDSEVVPIVVVWGKGASALPSRGVEVDDVRVLKGEDLREHLSQFRTGRVGRDWAEETVAKLSDFADSQTRRKILPQR